MAEFTEIENTLINEISDKKLRDSLSLIQESTIAIWTSDARIIQGYTDHGFNHCLRLLAWAAKLLNTNKGTALSDEEMYLLIAGIYLHDIGMQCDVTQFPEIRSKAIEFGAVFNIEFTTTNPNKYSDEEQIQIRNNHQYLSAAWIDYGFHNSETPLGTSIKSVPDNLISDLIDICKYHSKLNISGCPLQFELNTQGRKQLVASLVRFADELDVDKSRVAIETVMLFSLEPKNKLYWWLHHLTHIEINDNILILKVSLNKSDYSKYSSYIKDTYIEHFRKKNRDVLDILNNNKISIAISSESDVIEYEYAKKLPPEIENVIKEMQDKEVEKDNNKSTKDTRQTTQIRLKNYPIPKPYFSGRIEELKELKEAFELNKFISIDGGGGIGKTQLLAKLIDELQIQERIVWFECNPNSLPDDVIKGAGFEELLKGKDKTEREKFSAFKEKIEENKLVVFLDDYQEVENIPAFKSFLEFINDYLKKGHLIVLGRNKINSTEIQPKCLSLHGLGDDSLLHAQNLIEHSYPELKSFPVEDLRSLCNKLKGYPLAVDLAIYLLSLHVDVDNILTVAVSDAQYDSTIEEISNRLLNEIFTRPDASEEERDLLKSLSIFRGKIERNYALAIIPKDIFDRTSRKLFQKNLLDFTGNYLELHPLIREFSYQKLDNKKDLHLKVSEYFLEKRNDEWKPELEEKIFYHLSCAEEWIKISDTIINTGRDIILHGYLDRLQQMITLVKDQGIIKPIFDIYEGDIAQIKGDWDRALSIFGNAKQSSDEDVRIEGIIKYGEILFRQGNIKESKVFFEEVISITENKINNKWHARALNDLGLVYNFSGNLKDAYKLQNKALQIRQGLGDQEDIASSLNNIGSIKTDLGLNKEALELHEQSLKIEKEIGDKSGIARSLNNIGLIKSDLGLNNEALELYAQSLKIYEEIGDKSGIALSLNNIGSIKSDLGLNEEALELYEQSLKIDEEIGDKSGIASSLNNIGSLKSNLGLNEEALELYEQSLKIYEEIGNKSSIATSLNNIGSLKSNLGLKKEALGLHEQSLKIREGIGDKPGIANSLNSIGSRKDELGLKKEALELYEQSLKINEEIGNRSGIAACLNNLGAYLFKNKLETKKACFYLLKSLALYKFIREPYTNVPINYLSQLRKKIGSVGFESMVIESLDKLDDELKSMIDLNEILNKPVKVEKKQGRNDPCNCNSGKKYKQCCGKVN